MKKIFEHSKDLHVRNYVFYANVTDGKIYEDSSFETQADKATITDAFMKGMLVVFGDLMLTPVALDNTSITVICKTGYDALDFDSTATYSVGDKVAYEGSVYVCKTAIGTAGEWDSTKWDELTSADYVSFAFKT